MPIFILTRRDPDEMKQWLLVTYVNEVSSAMTQATEAAGEKYVLAHGAGTTQLALAAGILDEIELHVIPVLFGQGRRLFEGLPAERIELERTRILEREDSVTHMHYRVKRLTQRSPPTPSGRMETLGSQQVSVRNELE